MLYNLLNASTAVRLTRGWSKRASFPLFYELLPWEKPAFVLSFDVDFRRDVEALPEICAILEERGVPASFACVGAWVRKYPEEHRLLLQKGHEIFNHSMHHPDSEELDPRHWNSLSREEQRQEVLGAHRSIEEICGVAPLGFRMPHFGPQHRWHLYGILQELGYAYSSSTTCGGGYGFCKPLRVRKTGVLEFPTATAPGLGYASFDSFNYFNKRNPFVAQGRNMLGDFRRLLETIQKQKLLGTLYFDPYDFVARQEYREVVDLLEDCPGEIDLLRYQDCVTKVSLS